jgi:hypothetical protein
VHDVIFVKMGERQAHMRHNPCCSMLRQSFSVKFAMAKDYFQKVTTMTALHHKRYHTGFMEDL